MWPARIVLAMALASGVLATWMSGPTAAAAEPPVAAELPAAAGETIDFATQIQPLLSDRCALCHGPDAESREAELRVDIPDVLERPTQNGGLESVIVAGDAAASELVRRITSTDDSERMPPPESNLALSPEEIARISAWIDQGAVWEQHWSLQPIPQPPISQPPIPQPPLSQPAAAEAGNPINPIDAFINASLAAHRLRPSPAADPYRLIRRVTMDLTGLPPSPAEIQRFVEDARPDAYERLVDRLLASPEFGERMASPWLDLSRYADTYGYQSDVHREVWPWRDWVIDAFSRGLPYDQFVTHQLAGDLLSGDKIAEPARDAVLATTFNRLHRQTNEGGSVEEEFRAEYVADRVNTLGTAVLGLTLECARCHDHKYDPITQRDYYQLFAFFNQIDESGLYSHFTDAVPTPVLDLPTEDQKRELERARDAAEQAEQLYRQLRQQRTESVANPQDRQSEPAGEAAPLSGLLADEVGRFSFDFASDSGADPRPLDPSNAIAERPGGTLIGQPYLTADATQAEQAGGELVLDGENGFQTEVGGDWDWWQPFTIALWMRPAKVHERAVVWHRSRAWTDAGSRGYELLLEAGHLSAALIHFWPGDALRVRTVDPLPIERWSHVAIASDGSGRASGLRIFVDGQPAAVEVIRDSLKRTIRGGDAKTLAIGHRFRDRGFEGGAVDELRIFQRDLTAVEVALLARPPRGLGSGPESSSAAPLADADADSLREARLEATDQELRQAKDQLRLRRGQWAAARDAIPAIMAMRELPEPRETFLLSRGRYDAPDQPVTADVPTALGPLPPSLPRNRLGLARWLTDPSHPLVARVAANRLWQMCFDRGLVATPEDFGMQGEPPSHPELLDYLAGTLIADRWDQKRLLRQIVSSAAYRRTSMADPKQREADPENRWLARGPSSRWPVEMIRDAALAAGGLLDRRIGGPPVRPYQPAGLWSEKQAGSKYVRDVGAGSHRRSLYTYWKRTSPPPSMMIFDAPGREVCAASRATTQTPLQSLVLLNDEQFVEAARGTAYNLLRDSSGDSSEDAARLWFRMLGREASDAERQVIVDLVDRQQREFQQNAEARTEYLAIGDFQVDPDAAKPPIDRSAWAAWSVAAQMLMNLDEWVRRR